MGITRTDVEKIAELARLELTEAEAGSFTDQLSAIIGYIDQLNDLDTAGVESMSHCQTDGDARPARRGDEVRPSLGQQSATASAPDTEAGYFKVPKVIGQ
jgi:aspartyl-tRNA(Asn)/glutamyl-tRNA(Gln) amidotransferase subunit C